MSGQRRVPAVALRTFIEEVFCAAGVSKEQASHSADALVYADLRGTGSHGAARLAAYVAAIRRGAINSGAKMRLDQVAPTSAVLDADSGIGLAAGAIAMDHAVALAKASGTGVVTVRRSNHFGTGAYFVDRAAANGCIGMALSTAAATVAPWGAQDPYLGSNPIAIGVPGGRAPPFILDMATSAVARGRFRVAERRGEDIPEGLAIAPDGRPARTPADALAGTVLPFGGAKGAGLSMWVTLMAGMLSGAGIGREVHHMYEEDQPISRIGHFFLAIDIDPLMSIDGFRERFDTMVAEIKQCRPLAGVDEVMIPGERAEREIRRRRRDGIPLESSVVTELRTLARETGVALPGVLSSP